MEQPSPPEPLVDPIISRFRVTNVGMAFEELWPQDKLQFLTSESTAAAADAFYRASLPPPGTPVKLMIVSESPCFTRDDVSDMEMDLDELKQAGVVLPEGTPKEHVNLVHCLSYGEPWVLDESTISESTKDMKRQYSAGTWPFWKVLATLAGMTDVREDGYDPLETRETVKTAYKAVIGGGGASASKKRRQARTLAKHRILEKLREMGIVLIDTSPFAIYMGSGVIWRKNKDTGHEYHTPKHQLKGKEYNRLIQLAFEGYSGPFLQDVKPEKVLILGKKLEVALGRDFLENYVGSFGGTLLETVYHPCANEFFGKNTVTSLQTIRKLAIDARGPVQVTAQPIQVKVVRKRKKRSQRKSNKKTDKIVTQVSGKESVLVSTPATTESPKDIIVTPTAGVSARPKKKAKPSSRSLKSVTMAVDNTDYEDDSDEDSLYEPHEDDKENFVPIDIYPSTPFASSVTPPVAPRGSEAAKNQGRQSRTSQRTEFQAMYNTGKGWAWEEFAANGESSTEPRVAKATSSTKKQVRSKPATEKKRCTQPIKKKAVSRATRVSEPSVAQQAVKPTKKMGRQSRNSQRAGRYQCLHNSGKGWAWENDQ